MKALAALGMTCLLSLSILCAIWLREARTRIEASASITTGLASLALFVWMFFWTVENAP